MEGILVSFLALLLAWFSWLMGLCCFRHAGRKSNRGFLATILWGKWLKYASGKRKIILTVSSILLCYQSYHHNHWWRLGGMLTDAYQPEKLQDEGAHVDAWLIDRLLKASTNGLKKFSKRRQLQYPAEHRLAFRELGLLMWLHAVKRVWSIRPHVGDKFGSRVLVFYGIGSSYY